ncbi:E3 ubiquitin-protein ligase RNF216 [Frankliniella fusca]|uniref:E3 ubiquitin-protein ligase RNF216 n=1 Tax=Frankliniella fusca TaxID=407009 RepID=A0AAE1LBM5_9NEOP|nr:E3 ubiquitin-protein ligase RNF216 [Frankliniella fusca]
MCWVLGSNDFMSERRPSSEKFLTMDALVEDVSSVMDLLDIHHARHLVNENVVFERLETESLTSSTSGHELVNRVVQSFLVEFGLALPEEGPDIIPLPAVAAGPTSDRISNAHSPEVWVLSPSTVQALDEPYSPLPQCSDSIPSTDVKEMNKPSEDVPEDSKQPAASQNCGGELPDKSLTIDLASVSGQSSSGSSAGAGSLGAIPMQPSGQSSAGSSASAGSLGAIPKQPNTKDIVTTAVQKAVLLLDEPMEAVSVAASNVVDRIAFQDRHTPLKLKFSSSNPAEDGISSPSKRSRIEPLNESEKLIKSPNLRFPSSNSDSKRSPKSERVAARVGTLSEMFPEADPDYLWNRCENVSDDDSFNALIVQMLSDNDYPRVLDLKVDRHASAGSSKDLKFYKSTVSENQEIRLHSSSAKVSSSYPPVTNSNSVPVTSTTVASSSKPVKSEPLASTLKATAHSSETLKSEPSASTSKAPASTAKPLKSEPSASTSKAPAFSQDTDVKKEKIQMSSLSEVKRRLSLENGSEAAAVLREPWEDQLDTFLQIFPEADPSFLEEKARLLIGKEDELRVFVAEALEKKDYPSRKDWQWRQDQLALQKKYTEEFSIPNFLEIIPDPFTYFADQKRNPSHQNNQATMFLRNKYRKLRVTDITSAFSRNKYNLTLTCRELDNWKGTELKSRRNQVDYDLTRHDGGKGINVPFLQEAKENGELLECQCCYDSEVMLEDIRPCSEGQHIFCVTCVQRSSEQRIGDGHTTFPCLADCSSEFNLQTLRGILKPTVFSRLVQRKQVEEVKAAGIEDLVQCPFCDFCNIPPREDKIFRCLNPDCMKESCRLCKEISHVPLRCEEVEKKSETEMRTYIENQMTEALVRTCWKCARKFVKEDGCNKMTCQCGAMMCYICRQPVQNYSHFNGQGGDAYEKCPLYSDHHALEVAEVKKVAEQAKKEVMARMPNSSLKHDPTKILPVYQGPPRNDDSDSDLEDEEIDNDEYFDFYEPRARGWLDYFDDDIFGEDELGEEEEEEVEQEEEEEVEQEEEEGEDNKGDHDETLGEDEEDEDQEDDDQDDEEGEEDENEDQEDEDDQDDDDDEDDEDEDDEDQGDEELEDDEEQEEEDYEW